MQPRVLRMLLTLILALAIGASGPLHASAHGRDAGLTAMVICGKEGAATVYVDATGKRVDPGKGCLKDPCSACALARSVDVPVLAAFVIPPGRARALVPSFGADRPVPRRMGQASARGPPTGEDFA